MNERVVIIGAGGHARVIADIIRCRGDQVLGFLDDREAENFQKMTILGKTANALRYREYKFVIGIGRNEIRKSISERYDELDYYTAVHPAAVVAKDVRIAPGSVIMANAVINTGSVVGKHCIINTGATVDHDSVLGDYTHVSPGANLSGTVYVGESTWIGTGAVVCNNLKICGGCTVGAGAVVIKDIESPGIYAGVPAVLLK
jgi:sugar O-acyltransferase (sialic acid O-acetyltransferase NeuD family)